MPAEVFREPSDSDQTLRGWEQQPFQLQTATSPVCFSSRGPVQSESLHVEPGYRSARLLSN